jgi:predicted DNA-binding antitoxin AbrB/MazE fold protein
MTRKVRARVKRGTLELLEKLPLPEGEEVTITISTSPALDTKAFERAAGGWKGSVDADRLIADIYADRLISTRPAPSV